jgi:hypothetical protein
MTRFSNQAHSGLQCFDLSLGVNGFHGGDDIAWATPEDWSIHRLSWSVLVSALHPLTTHPERWERRFT